MLQNKDFWGGVTLMVIGAAAVFIARDYNFGSMQRMGPGFFPTVLGVILLLFGIGVMIKGFIAGEKIQTKWPLRPLILLPFSLVLFGVLMERLGLIPALVALIFSSAYAGKEFKLFEVCLLTIVLTGFSVGLFVWGLGLPFHLIKGF